MHEMPNPRQVLNEVKRILRPSGRFILVDWCDDYLACRLCGWYLSQTDPAYHRAYRLQACRLLLEQAGFQAIEAKRFRISWLWGMMRLVARAS